jgi:DNA (cytosine-5)-methyltransferase 1
MRKFNVLELCAGAGGLALGLEQSGFNTKYLIENNNDACKTLKRNRPSWEVLNMDINEIRNEELSKIINYNEIDLISGGFPCQPFSYAGKKLGFDDDRGNLFFSFARMIKKVKPKAILFENVKGLKNHDNGKTFETIKKTLTDLKYNVYYEILNANNFDVAQKRERLFIVGIRMDIDKNGFEFPKPFAKKPVLREILENVPESPYTPYSEKKAKVLSLVPQGGCWRNLPEEIAREYMKGSYYLGGGKTGIARRMSWDEPCLTLTTSPSQMQTERCHPDETRPFTIRECARIQSFPDNWIFEGSIASQYKQIGNAVPVKMAKEVGNKIRTYLEDIIHGN